MDLRGLVEDYAALGVHRTGTEVDAATIEWMADHLRVRDCEVEVVPFRFEQWVADSELLAGGTPVDHLPVFHEYVGPVTTDRPWLVQLDPRHGGFPGVLAQPVAEARAAGANALVAATTHPRGSLVAINRIPSAGSGFPVVLVAGRDHDRLARAPRHLRLDARLVEGRSATVVARNRAALGAPTTPPLMVTTPLTGWFRCAGERGTGIAVLLDLVERLADRPLLVVATTGHELDYLGARRWLAGHDDAPAAVLHIGASIGVEEETPDGARRLASTRRALTDLDAARAAAVTPPLGAARFAVTTSTPRWVGESEVFADLGVPMLSMSGAGLDFHTPDDLPERVTSSSAMATAADAVHAAALAFDDAVRRI